VRRSSSIIDGVKQSPQYTNNLEGISRDMHKAGLRPSGLGATLRSGSGTSLHDQDDSAFDKSIETKMH